MERVPVPAVSVVIPTCNRSELLRAGILSLTQAQPANGKYEVLIVDNGSTDGTPAMVDELRSAGHPVRLICEQRKGVSFARNAGVRAARAPLIGFMDDDQRAGPGWMMVVERAF